MLSEQVARFLLYAELVAFASLTVVTMARWLRQRDAAGLWLLIAFSLLTVLGVGNLFLPAPAGDPQPSIMHWFVVTSVLYAYCQYRFMVAFERSRLWEEIAIHALVIPTVVLTFQVKDFIAPIDRQAAWYPLYLVLLTSVWFATASLVAVRLWRAGRRMPAVARRRAQLLGAGTVLLTVATLVAMSVGGPDHPAVTSVVSLLAIVSAGVLGVGFAPPSELIRRWRHGEEVAFRAALGEAAISGVAGPALLTELLERFCAILGTSRADWLDSEGKLVGTWGVVGKRAREVRVGFAPEREMVVWVTRYTPFFRPEVLEGARSLAQMLNLTIEQADARLREAKLRADLVASQRIARLGSWTWNLSTEEFTWSDELYRIHGLDPDAFDISLTQYRALVHPADRPDVDAKLQQTLDGRAGFDEEFRIIRPDGEVRWVHSLGGLVQQTDGGPIEILGTCQDITERRELELRLIEQAMRDDLTGLPNRTMLMSRLREELSFERAHGRTTAVLFVDLDWFKVINDSLGHEAGDDLLVELAKRITGVLQPHDMVARFGGDEFVVLCTDVGGGEEALATARRVQDAARLPMLWRDAELAVSMSIGIALATHRGQDPSELIRDADAAMYRAKQQGRNSAALFADSMREEAVARLTTENDLRRAIALDELRVVYQPVVSLDLGSLVGFEALVRWEHPKRGLLTPTDFLAVAEETGMIVPIGEWVLEQACRQLVRWSEEFPHRSKVWMAVNLSARQISQPDFAERAAEILGRTGVDPGLVELEITESLLMLDTAESKGVLASLTRLGMRLSVDDFGTGYSSLSYLKRFPVHKLKIDRSFVRGIAADDDDSAIVEAILALSRSVGLMSVAEGIESRDQLKVLHRLGCPEGQGNFFSKPQPPEALRGLMAMPDITDLLTGSIA